MWRWIAMLALVMTGCTQSGNRWEAGFSVSVESKIDPQMKLVGGFQLKTPSPVAAKAKP